MSNDLRGLRVYYLLDQRSIPARNKGRILAPIRIDLKYPQGAEMIHLRFPIGLKGNPKYFHDQQFRGGETNGEEKNQILKNLKGHVQAIYLAGINAGQLPPREEFKARILAFFKEAKTEKTISGHLDDYIQYMNARKEAGRIKGKSVIYTLEKLKGYLEELYRRSAFGFESIDANFETRFLQLLVEKKLGPNTISTFVKRLKMFLNWATINNLNRNAIYKSFELKEEAREIVALSEIEVQALANLTLEKHKNITHGGTKVVRDWFIVATQTGLRYSDLHKIAQPQLTPVPGGYDLRVKTMKTGAEVVIPVSPVLYNVFKEYNFEMPLPPSNQKYNAGLKRIGEKAKLTKELSSHVARKTFCTVQYSKGVPTQYIMKISGHRTEKEFYRYIGVDGSENAQLIRKMNTDFVIQHEEKAKMTVNK
ncbi:tyrosine-type recombinase/integrase [Chryseolinea sp. T2]|uniref:site-specific integrase n=1 Tax=Chryseolinea sp. T2 TaxID=3129255 RepID=UPI003077FD68